VQVNIAMVVTRDGLPVGYEVFPGNTTGRNNCRSSMAGNGTPNSATGPTSCAPTSRSGRMKSRGRPYMQLTEAEAAFRIHKSNLGIRPCGTTRRTGSVPTSSFVSSPTSCGRRCRSGSPVLGSETHRERCLPSSRESTPPTSAASGR